MLNRIYEKLRHKEYFRDKLRIDDSKNCLTISFHEYLYLDYFEGSYKSAKDEGVIILNNHLTHWHITADDEALEIITAFAMGDIICIEDKSFLSFRRFRIMERESFEKKKCFMKKKSLRIYSGNAIIKRSN